VQLCSFYELPKSEQKKISARNKADRQQREENRRRQEGAEGPKVMALKKTIRLTRKLFSFVANLEHRTYVERDMDWTHADIVIRTQDDRRKVLMLYPKLLHWERALRKRGVNLPRWQNRNRVEQVIARMKGEPQKPKGK